MFVITDKLGVRPNEAAIENPARQALKVVRLYRFQVSDRDARLLRDVAQSNPSRLARESQFFSDGFRHFDWVSPSS